MWEIIKEQSTESKRVYRNNNTGSETVTKVIHTDNGGVKWWGFDDLFKIPYIRRAYAQNINDLFGIGVTETDLKQWIKEMKTMCKAKDDPERYEKLYSLLLNKEAIINNNVDPLKQHLGLCTIYVLSDDERIDYYSPEEAAKKMQLWQLDIDTCSFFLNWHSDHMKAYMKDLQDISLIASTVKELTTKVQ